VFPLLVEQAIRKWIMFSETAADIATKKRSRVGREELFYLLERPYRKGHFYPVIF
jgi:hypothetical protein